jgi:hypothetical protein
MLSAHIFCGNCGVKNQKNATFCFNCGSQLARPNANASTFQTPANVAGSDQQASAPSAQVSAPPKTVTEPPLPQGVKPPITNPSDSTTSEINSATGFLSTNTILKQRYRVLHSVGRGGMGAVYMGEDTQLGHRLVAIKEMSQGSLYPQEVQMGIDNFKHEAHLLAGLQHPNLPSIYDLGATLYHLLSGYAPSQSPFHLPPLQALVPTLPTRLTSLITYMLDLEENRRPPDMMAVKQELQAITDAPAKPNSERKPVRKPSSPKKVGAITLASLGSVLLLIGFVLLFNGMGKVWYVYFDYYSYYSDYESDSSFLGSTLAIGSITLFFGLLSFYILCAKNTNMLTINPITSQRKTIARVGIFLGCILLVWGIWGWIHASGKERYLNSSYIFNDNGHALYTHYIYTTFGFALIALTGIFVILATTTKSFGLSYIKSKKEMARRITTILATFVLLFGTTFLLPETIVISIICFLIGGGVLIATQWRQ